MSTAYKLTYYKHTSGSVSHSEYFATEAKAKETVNKLANAINFKIRFERHSDYPDFLFVCHADGSGDSVYQDEEWQKLSKVFPADIEKIKIQ